MIEMLKQLSPVPITVMALEYPKDLGVFYWGGEIAPFSGRRIEISELLSQPQHIVVLSHEVGHALCLAKNCKCFNNPNIIKREIHAHKYTLRLLLKHKQKEALKWAVEDIKNRSYYQDGFEKILKHLVKLKLWQKCLDYVK